MAFEAPLHLQRVLRIHQRHLVHAAVAARAAQPLVHMDLVAEVNKIRQVVYLGPHQALPRRPTVAHWLKQRGIGPDLCVAVDTGLGGWDSRVARFLNSDVTVLTLQTQSLHMMLVAERHRLVGTLTLSRHPGRALQLV